MKRLFYSIKTVYKIFIDHKLRFVLSVLGIAFGTFALIVMVSVSDGMKEKNKREIEKLGKNPIVVKSGKVFV
ncbi:MAG: ABC transporter permease, partial [Persephonella sp.]